MAIGADPLERACLTAVWLLACVSCNAITGASDLAVGDQGETDAGGVGPRVDDGGSGSDATGQPDAFVSGPFAYHRTISLTAHGAARGPILLVLPSSFTYAHVKANGDDMRFSTTPDRSDDVPYFIETWSAGGESLVWLRPGAIPANDGGGGGGGGRIKLRHGAVYAAPATMTAAFGLGATQAATTAPGANGTIGTTDVSASASLVTGYDAALGAEAP